MRMVLKRRLYDASGVTWKRNKNGKLECWNVGIMGESWPSKAGIWRFFESTNHW